MSINAVEAYSVDNFSPEAIRANLAEAQKIANGSGSENDITEAKIEIEVCPHPMRADKAPTNGRGCVRFWRRSRLQ